MKKISIKRLLVIIAIVVVVLAGVGGGVAYAYWRAVLKGDVLYEMGVDNENASLKYQIFVPLDEEGNRIDGYHDIEQSMGYASANYITTGAGTVSGLALVGWEGGIDLDYIIIPDEATVMINDVEQILPVTKVIVDYEFHDYFLRGNSVITSVTFGKNVTFVATGAFSAMENLEKTSIAGDINDPTITFGKDCFAACPKWGTIISEHNRQYVLQE